MDKTSWTFGAMTHSSIFSVGIPLEGRKEGSVRRCAVDIFRRTFSTRSASTEMYMFSGSCTASFVPIGQVGRIHVKGSWSEGLMAHCR